MIAVFAFAGIFVLVLAGLVIAMPLVALAGFLIECLMDAIPDWISGIFGLLIVLCVAANITLKVLS